MADPARVKNLQGLLKWSASQETEGSDGPVSLDPERKEFLSKVLASLEAGVIEQIQQIFQVVSLPGDNEADVSAKVEALEALSDLIEDIDNAGDFVKIGGVGICYAAIKSTHEEIQSAALTCLAAAAQNNPQVQHHLHKTDLLSRLNGILASSASVGLHTRAVHALSCGIRGQPVLVQAWCDGEGPAVLNTRITSVGSPNARFMVKVSNMLASLPVDYPAIRGVLVRSGLLAAIQSFLSSEHADDAVWEHTTRAMLRAAQDTPDAVTVLKDASTVDLIRKWQASIEGRPPDDQEALVEAKQYASALLSLLSS